MGIEAEIYRRTGAHFKSIPGDGNMRSFIRAGHEYFALSFGSCGVFGNWTTKEFYEYDGVVCKLIPCDESEPVVSRQQYQEERKIVAIGNSMTDNCQSMSAARLDRYILALTRVIEFDQHEQRQRLGYQAAITGAQNGIAYERP